MAFTALVPLSGDRLAVHIESRQFAFHLRNLSCRRPACENVPQRDHAIKFTGSVTHLRGAPVVVHFDPHHSPSINATTTDAATMGRHANSSSIDGADIAAKSTIPMANDNTIRMVHIPQIKISAMPTLGINRA